MTSVEGDGGPKPGSPSSLESRIGYRFKDKDVFREALTHKSFASETKSDRYNERLEFLGDSVLALVVAQALYERSPRADEGSLSKQKSLLVSRPSLAKWAAGLELGKFLHLGAGEDASGGRDRPSILANAVEALLGAMFLDGGLEPPAKLIRGWLAQSDSDAGQADHKSKLQELMQKRYKSPPQYELMKSSGPDHDRTFGVTVRMGKQVLGTGTGKTKKEAEQSAAQDALGRLESE